MRESENKKRTLEENIDSLREECAKLKTAEHVSAVNAEEKEKAEQLRSMFDNQMDELRDAHTKQVAELRDEISEKQDSINELKEYVLFCRSYKVYIIISFFSYVHSFNQKLTLTHQQMTTDYEKLRQEETDKSSKLQELMSVPNNNKNCYKNNKYNVSSTSPLSVSSPNTSPSRIVNCLSSKKQQNCPITDNMLLDEFDIDEQNFNKIRKNFFNTQCQHHLHQVHDDDNYNNIDDVYAMKKHHHDNEHHSQQHHQNSKSLLSTLCRTIPLALPTLQLHLLISLTMVLLTHRCPQYLIVL